MKFIHVTDIHLTARTPKYRKDDFLKAAIEKIRWVQDYAANVGAAGILCTGDFYDRADTAYSVLNEIIPVLKDSIVPWFSIIGNHDEYGYNPDTIDRTPLGCLFNSGLMKYVSYESPYFIEGHNEIVCITGADSTIETDNRPDKEYDYGIMNGNNFYTAEDSRHVTTIHLSHGFLADKDWGDKIHHTRIEEIASKVEADIVLCGHEHHGFGVKHIDSKIFANPGALCRITAGVGDINREVNITEITIEGFYRDAKLVSVEIAKDVEDTIDIDKAQAEKDRVQTLSNFSQAVNSIDIETVSLNPFEAIDAISNEVFTSLGVPEEMFSRITSEAKLAIQDAHEKIGGDI